ncbi:methionyl-tRNA formyltransferase [Candidatus Saccharibacteria bacterium]|nr:methionyl-tRNA formyltransferase [Candidatus Saccharibacteria bacterium]
MKTKILFFGNEQLAQGIKAKTPIFDALVNSPNFEIQALLLTNPNPRKPYQIEKAAKAAGVPVFFSKNSAEILEIIAKYDAEVAVLASFGKIIPDSVISAFPCGIINIHPSLLPKYRGTTPIESAILNGDKETGVSVMRLTKAMDAGPILAQETIEITPEDDKQTLYEKLATAGAQQLVRVLPGVVAKTAPERSQNGLEATFTTPLTKDMSLLQPDLKTAETLSNEIRAFTGFPKSKTAIWDIPCIITKAHVSSEAASDIDIKCSDDNYLVIDRLIPENSKEMDAAGFINGHKKSPR